MFAWARRSLLEEDFLMLETLVVISYYLFPRNIFPQGQKCFHKRFRMNNAS